MEKSNGTVNQGEINGVTLMKGADGRLTPEMLDWVTNKLGMTEEQYLAEVDAATRDSVLRAQAESAHNILGPLSKRR